MVNRCNFVRQHLKLLRRRGGGGGLLGPFIGRCDCNSSSCGFHATKRHSYLRLWLIISRSDWLITGITAIYQSAKNCPLGEMFSIPWELPGQFISPVTFGRRRGAAGAGASAGRGREGNMKLAGRSFIKLCEICSSILRDAHLINFCRATALTHNGNLVAVPRRMSK